MGKAFVLVSLLMGRAADKIGDAIGYPCGFAFSAGGVHPLERGRCSRHGGELAAYPAPGKSIVPGFEDGRGRAVAFGQTEHCKFGPARAQGCFNARIRASEAVDGLIRVADAEEA